MPKIGMEEIRKRALVDAAIAAVHARGSINVTISDIAKRAGVSQGLAHHYFGSKDELMLAAMRHLLGEFGADVRKRLRVCRSPRERLSAVIQSSLGTEQFNPETITVWLVFYVHAQASKNAHELLTVYARRLHSNLVHALRPLAGDNAPQIAAAIGALIDGIYIRQSLGTVSPGWEDGVSMVEDYADMAIAKAGEKPGFGN